MADEVLQPGMPGLSPPVEAEAPLTEDMSEYIRPGAPGRPGDMVSKSRMQPPKSVAKPEEPKDSTREVIETIVFVIVLVFMLKTFLAEAFVIPTGSMATTLLGYHKDCTCQQCGYPFRVNCSSEAEPTDGREDVLSADCPNCRFRNQLIMRNLGGNP